MGQDSGRMVRTSGNQYGGGSVDIDTFTVTSRNITQDDWRSGDARPSRRRRRVRFLAARRETYARDDVPVAARTIVSGGRRSLSHHGAQDVRSGGR